MAVSRSSSPPPPLPESEGTTNVKEHFTSLAAAQRRGWNLEQYYGAKRDPETAVALLEFTANGPLQPRTPTLDGFITQHVNVFQNAEGITSGFAVYERRLPYEWPRTLDVMFGPDTTLRADLDTDRSTNEIAFYRISSNLRFDMKSPNGQFAWDVTKDKDVATSPKCLYRQDLYRDGQWIRSLVALAKLATSDR